MEPDKVEQLRQIGEQTEKLLMTLESAAQANPMVSGLIDMHRNHISLSVMGAEEAIRTAPRELYPEPRRLV